MKKKKERRHEITNTRNRIHQNRLPQNCKLTVNVSVNRLIYYPDTTRKRDIQNNHPIPRTNGCTLNQYQTREILLNEYSKYEVEVE